MYRKYIKRILDVIVSLIAIIVLSPIFLVLWILVKFKLGTPVIFKQERPGVKEKIFTLYKFRTMTDEKDEKGNLLSDEIRLTKFGSFLRSTSLDELPELFNILKGDMSIVGPRPLLPEYLPLYNEDQKHRHDVRPGLTGLAQVNGRNSISWEEKFELDIKYINSISFLQDIKIILKTVEKVFKREGISQENNVTNEYFTGTKIEEIKMQTPYYVLRKKNLDCLINELKESVDKYWPNAIIAYSCKTNSLPWLLKYMKELGFWAEVVSKTEYDLVQEIGYNENIVYNGPIKDEISFKKSLYKNNIINIDSQREINWVISCNKEKEITSKIGIRVNFDIESYCPGESQCGDEGGRFGFCYENKELYKVINKLKSNNVKISGLHMHCSSKTRSLNIYKTICIVAKKIIKEYNLNDIKFIDIGGGFFGGVEGKPQFDDYLKIISQTLADEIDSSKVKIVLEPGMALVAAPFDYITSVIDVKQTTHNRFVITDGSRTSIDPFFRKTEYTYFIKYKSEKRKQIEKQVVCAYTCLENDRIMILNDDLELFEGDKIIYTKIGGYTMTLTPLFIEYYPDVYLDDGENYKLIRKKWNEKKLLEE